MPRKTEFELETMIGIITENAPGCTISITGQKPESSPYVCVTIKDKYYFIKDRDLERFAVNILKALGSKKILSEQELKFVRSQKTRKRPLK